MAETETKIWHLHWPTWFKQWRKKHRNKLPLLLLGLIWPWVWVAAAGLVASSILYRLMRSLGNLSYGEVRADSNGLWICTGIGRHRYWRWDDVYSIEFAEPPLQPGKIIDLMPPPKQMRSEPLWMRWLGHLPVPAKYCARYLPGYGCIYLHYGIRVAFPSTGLSTEQQQEILAYAAQKIAAHPATRKRNHPNSKPFAPANNKYTWVFGTATEHVINSILSPLAISLAAIILLVLTGLVITQAAHSQKLDMTAILAVGIFTCLILTIPNSIRFLWSRWLYRTTPFAIVEQQGLTLYSPRSKIRKQWLWRELASIRVDIRRSRAYTMPFLLVEETSGKHHTFAAGMLSPEHTNQLAKVCTAYLRGRQKTLLQQKDQCNWV